MLAIVLPETPQRTQHLFWALGRMTHYPLAVEEQLFCLDVTSVRCHTDFYTTVEGAKGTQQHVVLAVDVDPHRQLHVRLSTAAPPRLQLSRDGCHSELVAQLDECAGSLALSHLHQVDLVCLRGCFRPIQLTFAAVAAVLLLNVIGLQVVLAASAHALRRRPAWKHRRTRRAGVTDVLPAGSAVVAAAAETEVTLAVLTLLCIWCPLDALLLVLLGRVLPGVGLGVDVSIVLALRAVVAPDAADSTRNSAPHGGVLLI